jgi:hypothetical protein
MVDYLVTLRHSILETSIDSDAKNYAMMLKIDILFWYFIAFLLKSFAKFLESILSPSPAAPVCIYVLKILNFSRYSILALFLF